LRVLTYSFADASALRLRLPLREIATSAPPAVAGLCARHWRIDHKMLQGRYLFRDRDSLDAFARGPQVDPAFTRLAGYFKPASPKMVAQEEIASNKVFDRPIFIISAPRAGSTMLFELLSQSSTLWTIDGETEDLIEGIAALNIANRNFDSHRLTDLDATIETVQALKAGIIAELRNQQRRRYLELPEPERPQTIRALEKTPENALRVAFLAHAFPDARFIFLHREARQNVNSILEAWHHDGFINIPRLPGWKRERWHFLLPQGWHALNDAPLMEVAAFQWSAANQQALEDLEAVPQDRWISIDYMELLGAPESVVHRVCALAEIAFDDRLAAALSRPLPLAATTVRPPSPIKWRSNPEFRESALSCYTLLSARLRHLGNVSPSPIPRRPHANVNFSCFLNSVVPLLDACEADWMVAPGFYFQLGVTVPLPLLPRTRFRERFLPGYPLLWVEDVTTRIMYPFWVERQQAGLFRRFAAGFPPPSTLSPELAAKLASVGILVTPAGVEHRRLEGDAVVKQCKARFAEHHYCSVPALIKQPHAISLSRYYRAMAKCGNLTLGDEQVHLRYGFHNETMSRYFHHQLTGFVSRIAGEPVKPTYTYVSAYQEGAVLKPHVDRKQCVFTLSLWLGDDANQSPEPWPLWLQTDEGKVAVTHSAGDGVLFRGCDLPHWRDQPPPGYAPTTLLLHYVPRDFVGVLD
jgi:hypothetical protein